MADTTKQGIDKMADFLFSLADTQAISAMDSEFLNNKGDKLYREQNYGASLEYFRIACAMGNVKATTNIGTCYLYGHGTEANLSLAFSYFKIAVRRQDAEAAYKLGDIFFSDKWGLQDKEMSTYYYRLAVTFVLGEPLESNTDLTWCSELQKYPDLCFAMGRELSKTGSLLTDIETSYQFLKHAELGYEKEMNNGKARYEAAYEGVLNFMDDPQYDEIRERFDTEFLDEY